ncbi:MAG: FkbM family methyltransferase [Proteobacteria bacterium]|nr:FkbM family methyltransferase [Pseudomonadota bacterium]
MVQRVFARLVEVLPRLMPGHTVRTVFDVGARDCEESRQFALAFPEARVYAFECNPATLSQCRAVAAAEPRITLTEKAASELAGSISFYPIDQERTQTGVANGNPGASSLLRATGNYPEEHYVQKEIRVETIRLDTFMRERGIAGIDVLWMDVQGAEGRVLEGLGERLRDLRCLHMEVEFFEIYKGQSLFGDVDPWLRARGFRLLGFTSYSRFAADAIYVRDDIPVDRKALEREFPYLARNVRKARWHRLKRGLRRMVGLPAWREGSRP